jgi:Bacterial Ig-like domain (group 2)
MPRSPLRPVILFAALTLAAAACGRTTTAPGERLPPFVMPANATIAVGETVQLSAVLVAQTNVAWIWASRDTAVAAVDSKGLVTAVAPGIATITAEAPNGVKGAAQVTVTE